MEPSRTEKAFANIFSVIFNPLILPSYIFVLCSYMIPLCRIYFILYPQLFFMTLLIEIVSTLLLPLIYVKHFKKQDIAVTSREVLVFALIINSVNFLLMRNFLSPAAYIPVSASFIITFTAIILLLIQSYFIKTDINSTVIGILLGFAFLIPYQKTFTWLSVILLSGGLILSLYIVSGKSTLKKTLCGLITGFCAVGVYLLIG